jgi:hypothetical protein
MNKYTVRINFQGKPVFERNEQFIEEIATQGIAEFEASNPEFAAFRAEYLAGKIKPISVARRAQY